MKWMEFIDFGPVPVIETTKIPVQQHGISKFVYVRTKKNGGVVMDQALREFIKAAQNLSDNWDNDYPGMYENYPKYLPSFDEFVADFRGMIEGTL